MVEHQPILTIYSSACQTFYVNICHSSHRNYFSILTFFKNLDENRQNLKYLFKVKIWFQNHRYKLKKSRVSDDFSVNPSLPNFIAMRGASDSYRSMMGAAASASQTSSAQPFGYGSQVGPYGSHMSHLSSSSSAQDVGHHYSSQYSNYLANNYSSYAGASSASAAATAAAGYTSHQHPLPAAVPSNLPWY